MNNRKLRLDLDQLTVESFALMGGAADGAGTVRAHGELPPDEPASDWEGVCNTYGVSCNGSCGSCLSVCYATCGNSCNGSCNVNVTCGQSCHSVCYEPA
jgi:hypothetical protein